MLFGLSANLPVDQGAWLYIAKLNKENPWMLNSDPSIGKARIWLGEQSYL